MAKIIDEFKIDRKLRRKYLSAARRPFNWLYCLLFLFVFSLSYPLYTFIENSITQERNAIAYTDAVIPNYLIILPFILIFLIITVIPIYSLRWHTNDGKILYKAFAKMKLTTKGLSEFYRIYYSAGLSASHVLAEIDYQSMTALTVYTSIKTGLSYLRIDGVVNGTVYRAHSRGYTPLSTEVLDGVDGFRYFPLYYKNNEKFLSVISERSHQTIQYKSVDDCFFSEKRFKSKF